MARIERDGFHGGHKVTGLEGDIAKARKNARFRQDMSRISGDAADSVGDSFTGAARTTGLGALLGGFFIYRLLRNPRSRYKLQAVGHLFVALFVSGWVLSIVFPPIASFFIDSTDQDAWKAAQPAYYGITIIIAVVWTAAYVWLRTLPKLRRLRAQA